MYTLQLWFLIRLELFQNLNLYYLVTFSNAIESMPSLDDEWVISYHSSLITKHAIIHFYNLKIDPSHLWLALKSSSVFILKTQNFQLLWVSRTDLVQISTEHLPAFFFSFSGSASPNAQTTEQTPSPSSSTHRTQTPSSIFFFFFTAVLLSQIVWTGHPLLGQNIGGNTLRQSRLLRLERHAPPPTPFPSKVYILNAEWTSEWNSKIRL